MAKTVMTTHSNALDGKHQACRSEILSDRDVLNVYQEKCAAVRKNFGPTHIGILADGVS